MSCICQGFYRPPNCPVHGRRGQIAQEIHELVERPQWGPPPEVQVRVVCAALRGLTTGLIVCGPRHFDHVMHATLRAVHPEGGYGTLYEAGFVDQFGRFMDRVQAWEVATAAGQIRKSVSCDGELYSENLY
jgi:hypothetical protein